MFDSLFHKTLTKTPNLRFASSFISSFNYSSTPKSLSGFENPQNHVQPPMVMEDKDETSIAKPKVWPKFSKIPFQSRVANLVNLIGSVRMPVEFITTVDGISWAGTVISQDQNSSTSPLFWIPIVFKGELAHAAATHVKVLDNVYVSGQLNPDPLPVNLTNDRVDVQVLVHDHFVRRYQNIMEKRPHRFKPTTTTTTTSH